MIEVISTFQKITIDCIIENMKRIPKEGLTVNKNGVLIRPSIRAGDSGITVPPPRRCRAEQL